jgi:hypothetical protein
MQFVRRFAEGGNTATPAPNNAFQQAAEKVSAIYTPQAASTGSPFAAASNQVANTLGVSANMFPQAPAPQQSGLASLAQTANTAAPQQSGIGSLDSNPTPQMQQGVGSLNTPMYSRHEGMLYGDDFYDQYAQNKGGQFVDPYHNFLMTKAKVIGPDADIDRLYQQYKASGRTDTPDWATLDTKGPISTLPMLAHKWDASGANPVSNLLDAWNPTTPLAEGVTVPEGYWDNYLAYNMNMSKAHPTFMTQGNAVSDSVKDNNARALNAMAMGEYGNQGKIFNSYLTPNQAAASKASRQSSLANSQNYFNYMKNNNTAHAQMYGYSADDANSELDRKWDEMVAEMEAAQAAEDAMLASYTYGGGGGGGGTNGTSPVNSQGIYISGPNAGFAGPISSGYTPINTNMGMGGVSGPANYGGGTAGPKLASGGLATLRYK